MRIRPFIKALCAIGIFSASSASFSADSFSCVANKSWITSPNAPAEVPKGKDADFCEFYQFSWQWFLQLVSPVKGQDIRQFQVQKNYPVLEATGQNSCDQQINGPVLFAALNKIKNGFDIPERTGQAGTGGEAIFDQAKNIVFYEVRFDRNLCNVGKIQANPNFPGGTTEIKIAWKVLTSADDSTRYFVMKANIDGVAGDETLGLIGFHLAMATDLHPEMVWSSFEHIDNSAECNNGSENDQTWSFTSKACIEKPDTCTFNQAVEPTPGKITGTATEICTSHPGGMEPGDPHFDKNSVAVNDLNIQINAFLSELKQNDPMSVWKNYKNIGALWVSDTSKGSFLSGTPDPYSNQRGSMRLANTVMETTFQDGFVNNGVNQGPYSSNCFGCHEYTVDPVYRNTGPHNRFDVSHIFINDILAGQCKNPTDVNAGPIGSDADAQSICAKTCENKGGWNGNWKTTTPGTQSVCACCNAKK